MRNGVKYTRVKLLGLALTMLVVSCGEAPEANLQQKAEEVSGILADISRRSAVYDSLYTVREELARSYTDKVRLEKVNGENLIALAELYNTAGDYSKVAATLER